MLKRLYGPILFAKADRLGTYAAALAYCLVLSLIPFLLVTFTLGTELTHQNLARAYSELLLDILPVQTSHAIENTESISPPITAADTRRDHVAHVANLSTQIVNTLQSSSHRGLATIGFIFALYTSFNLMTQIVRTLMYIFDDPRRSQEWTWQMVFKTIALFVIWMLLLLLFAAYSVVTPVITKMLEQAHLNPVLWTGPLLIARNVIGVAFLFGAFFLTFLLVPTKHYRLCQVRDGSLVASMGWVLCSLLFAYVLPSMWKTNAVYEALGSIVIILLWSQACAWSVIIGACWMVRFPPGARKKAQLAK
jgi:YihY family inner membrane protein